MDNGYSIEQFNDEMKNQQLFQYDESNDYMNNMFVVTSNKEFPQGLTLQQQQSNLQVEHVEQQNVIGEIQNQQVQLQQSQQVNQQQQNNVDQDDKNENLSIDSSYQSSNFMNHISNQEQSSRDKQSTNDESLVTSGQNEEFNTASKKSKGNITKKYISKGKRFEPICDQNVMYKYEDDPVEYKKARKRIQNRQSATRVRYRKKNYACSLESQLEELKEINSNLLQLNAKLQAENSLLKNQMDIILRNNIVKSPIQQENKSDGTKFISNDNNNTTNNTNSNIDSSNHASIDVNQPVTSLNQTKTLITDQLPIVDAQYQRVSNQVMRIGSENKKSLFIFGLISTLMCFLMIGSDDQIKINSNYQNLIQMAQSFGNFTSIIKSQGEPENEVNVVEILYKQNKFFIMAKQFIFLSVSFIYLGYFIYYCYDKFLYKIFSKKQKQN